MTEENVDTQVDDIEDIAEDIVDDDPADDFDADDEGDDSDDAEGQVDPDDADEVLDVKPASRSASRVQKLAKEQAIAKRELAETKAREAELQRRLDEVNAQNRYNPQAEAARQAEMARVAQMDPLERENYEIKRKLDETQGAIRNLEFKHQDALDREKFQSDFNRALEKLPGLKRHGADVEKVLEAMRKNNVNAPRIDILYHAYGKAAIEKALSSDKAAGKRKEAAESRVAAVRGRSANLRGDATGGSKGKTEEDRLRGVQI